MGEFIHLAISKSVTKEEWENVYNDTLDLIKNFPLAEKRKVTIHGVDMFCLAKTEERFFSTGWDGREKKLGWGANGDIETLAVAEKFILLRDLIGENEVEADAGDAMLGACQLYLNYGWKDERFTHVYREWGDKTQGEPYHIYLLAVACLIEARLGTKAFVYGDITWEQCKSAIEIANEFLDEKIEMPDRCYADRLMRRVNALDFSEREKLDLFDGFYLGIREAAYGETLRQYFSRESLDSYWESKFQNSRIGTIGFNQQISEYLLWGFEIDKLCKFVNFEDYDGKMLYDKFVIKILDAKLHLKDKNCADPSMIDQEEKQPYDIWRELARFCFAGAENKKVDRYVPIDEIRAALRAGLAGKYDVDPVIDEYLKTESDQIEINLMGKDVTAEQVSQAAKQDAGETLGQIIERKRAELIESYVKYDINDFDVLIGYKAGDTIHPNLAKFLGDSRKLLDKTLEEDEFMMLSNESVQEKFKWIVRHNFYILVPETYWETVYKKLEDDPSSFSRYYSLMRVDARRNNLSKMTRAFMVNDDLWRYTKELADNINRNEG